jgi:hypothetical protein
MSIAQAGSLAHQLRSISVKFCAAQTDPANAADNLLTEAVRLLEIAEQFHKDTRVSPQTHSESPLFLPDFGVMSSGSGHLSRSEVSPTYTCGTSFNLLTVYRQFLNQRS